MKINKTKKIKTKNGRKWGYAHRTSDPFRVNNVPNYNFNNCRKGKSYPRICSDYEYIIVKMEKIL